MTADTFVKGLGYKAAISQAICSRQLSTIHGWFTRKDNYRFLPDGC